MLKGDQPLYCQRGAADGATDAAGTGGPCHVKDPLQPLWFGVRVETELGCVTGDSCVCVCVDESLGSGPLWLWQVWTCDV